MATVEPGAVCRVEIQFQPQPEPVSTPPAQANAEVKDGEEEEEEGGKAADDGTSVTRACDGGGAWACLCETNRWLLTRPWCMYACVCVCVAVQVVMVMMGRARATMWRWTRVSTLSWPCVKPSHLFLATWALSSTAAKMLT